MNAHSTTLRACGLVGSLVLVAACSGAANGPPARSSSGVPATLAQTPAGTLAATSPATPASVVAARHAPLTGQIVFSDSPSGSAKSQVYVEAADGSKLRKVVASAFDDRNPSLSPDGRRVAFTRYLPDGAPPDGGVFVVNVDGSGLRQLDAQGEDVSWSPDGKRLVDTHALFDKGAAGPYNVALWVMDVDGSHKHQVTLLGKRCEDTCAGGEQHNDGVWSPDGKRLAFKRDLYTSPEQFSIYTVATDGADLRRVTPEGLNAGDPAWSPDGTLIAFQSPPEANQGGEQNIFTIHPDGSGLRQLTQHLSSTDGRQGTFHPSWSPDGRQLLFSHNPGATGPRADLFVMNADGSDVHVIAATTLNENWPNWGVTPGS